MAITNPTNVNGHNINYTKVTPSTWGHFFRDAFTGNVNGMAVTAQSTPNMTVAVAPGTALLTKNTLTASFGEIKSGGANVSIPTANTSNPRIDTIIIMEDTAVSSALSAYVIDGAGGSFKIGVIPGTAASSPVANTDAQIATAIGSSTPWTRLADITVPTNTTTITNSNIADKRALLASSLPAASVKASNIDFTTFAPIQTYTNPGNAAGTVYYQVNTATGIKEAWGTTPAATVNASTVLLNINLPPGFFTSIKSSLASPINATGNADIGVYPESCSTTNFAIYAFGKSSGNTVCITFYIRGT